MVKPERTAVKALLAVGLVGKNLPMSIKAMSIVAVFSIIAARTYLSACYGSGLNHVCTMSQALPQGRITDRANESVALDYQGALDCPGGPEF